MIHEVCLDANIIISCLANEPSHEVCQAVLQRLLSAELDIYAPALLVFEVSSSFRRKVLQNEMTAQAAEEALDIFDGLPILVQWQPHITRKAFQFAQKLSGKNIYDASYLAVAEARQMPCITIDDDFRKKGKCFYNHIYTPEEFLLKWSAQ